jgi:hypothetical protein
MTVDCVVFGKVLFLPPRFVALAGMILDGDGWFIGASQPEANRSSGAAAGPSQGARGHPVIYYLMNTSIYIIVPMAPPSRTMDGRNV